MKSRVNDSYIYFFMDPNIVFVYKIESLQYVTAREFFKRGERKTFELKAEEHFEMFNHKEHQSLEGKGYYLNQDSINKMVEKINEVIHEKRQAMIKLKNEEEIEEYHLVCSDNAAGSLRVGLKHSKTIIALSGLFSIGPIWKLQDKEARIFRNEWLLENINFFGEDNYQYENQFSNSLYKIADIPENAPIHIWYGNNADEQTGIRFILYFLKNRGNNIYLRNAIDLYHAYPIPPENEIHHLYCAGDIQPHLLYMIYEKNKTIEPLSVVEMEKFQTEWEDLSQTKDVLRIWDQNEIKSVSEDYYDSSILSILEELHKKEGKKEFIKTGRVIGQVIAEIKEPLGDLFLEYRIRHLVYSGKLEMKGIPKTMRHYSVKIRDEVLGWKAD